MWTTRLSQSTFCSELEPSDSELSNYNDQIYTRKKGNCVVVRRSQRIKNIEIMAKENCIKNDYIYDNKKVGRSRKMKTPTTIVKKKSILENDTHKPKSNEIKKLGRPRKTKSPTKIVKSKMILENMKFIQNTMMQCNRIICNYIFSTQKQNIFGTINSKFNEIITKCNIHALKWNAIKSNISKANDNSNENCAFLNNSQSDIRENVVKKIPVISKELYCFQPVHKFITDAKQLPKGTSEEPVNNNSDINLTTCQSESVLKGFSPTYTNITPNMEKIDDNCKASFTTNALVGAVNSANDIATLSQDMFSQESLTYNETEKIKSDKAIKLSHAVSNESKENLKKEKSNDVKKPSQIKQPHITSNINTNNNTIQYDLQEFSKEKTIDTNITCTQNYESTNTFNTKERNIIKSATDFIILNEKPIDLDEDEPNINQTTSFEKYHTKNKNNNHHVEDESYMHFYKNYEKSSASKQCNHSTPVSYQQKQKTTQIDTNSKTSKKTEKHADVPSYKKNTYIECNKPTYISNFNEQNTQRNPLILHSVIDKNNSNKIEEDRTDHKLQNGSSKKLENTTVEINYEKTFKQYDWLKPIKYVHVLKKDINNKQRNKHPKEFWDNPNAEIPEDWLKDFDD
ncbi:uncharacterized protein LOC143914096 [Arctopsyche grandis]|uniref:uncharacterized protein LOC143914096 n=1 Tax=Arctopsyche grandis TaxID=121162 RepID=UPI00406D73D1